MAETVQKQNLDLDNMENFETGKDRFAFFDHFSKFSGLAVAQLYLICAAVTGYEVISRYDVNQRVRLILVTSGIPATEEVTASPTCS